jgi:hypothetical protein
MLGHDSVTDARAQNAVADCADPRDRAVLIERLRRRGVLANLPLTLRRKDGRLIAVAFTLTQSQAAGETFPDAVEVEVNGECAEDDGPPPPTAGQPPVPEGVLVAC